MPTLTKNSSPIASQLTTFRLSSPATTTRDQTSKARTRRRDPDRLREPRVAATIYGTSDLLTSDPQMRASQFIML